MIELLVSCLPCVPCTLPGLFLSGVTSCFLFPVPQWRVHAVQFGFLCLVHLFSIAVSSFASHPVRVFNSSAFLTSMLCCPSYTVLFLLPVWLLVCILPESSALKLYFQFTFQLPSPAFWIHDLCASSISWFHDSMLESGGNCPVVVFLNAQHFIVTFHLQPSFERFSVTNHN